MYEDTNPLFTPTLSSHGPIFSLLLYPKTIARVMDTQKFESVTSIAEVAANGFQEADQFRHYRFMPTEDRVRAFIQALLNDPYAKQKVEARFAVSARAQHVRFVRF